MDRSWFSAVLGRSCSMSHHHGFHHNVQNLGDGEEHQKMHSLLETDGFYMIRLGPGAVSLLFPSPHT